jgi:hypothetical protein
MNCGDCKDYEKEDSWCKCMEQVVHNPSWDKPCCVKAKDEKPILKPS